MALINPAPGDTVAAADIDNIRNHLEGASGSTAPYHFRQSTGNLLITLATADGSNGLRVNDSAGVQQSYLDSDGNLTLTGSFTPGTLILPNAASPAQTTEASIIWDSDDDIITVGNGAGVTRFGKLGSTSPGPSSGYTGGTSNEVARLDHSHVTAKYKSATQVITTNTTFADVAAASGNFAFTIAASEVWAADFWIPVVFGGTGGVKFQLTGPGSPTAVFAEAYGDLMKRTGSDATNQWQRVVHERIGTVTSFSSALVSTNSEVIAEIIGTNTAFGTDRVFDTDGTTIYIRAVIQNGANAGTVTLQAAQNSSNSTTTLGLGCFMRAERIA